MQDYAMTGKHKRNFQYMFSIPFLFAGFLYFLHQLQFHTVPLPLPAHVIQQNLYKKRKNIINYNYNLVLLLYKRDRIYPIIEHQR